MSVHDRIESRFERWGYFVCRRRWETTVLVLLVTGLLAAWIPSLEGDFSNESYLRTGDPARVAYEQFRDQFDRDDRILIGLAPPEVFDLAFLEKLGAFHRELERELPYVESLVFGQPGNYSISVWVWF